MSNSQVLRTEERSATVHETCILTYNRVNTDDEDIEEIYENISEVVSENDSENVYFYSSEVVCENISEVKWLVGGGFVNI